MIEFHELHYTKAELASAPAKDRLFYLMATGLANDLQTLMKLFAVALGEEQDELIIRQGSSTVGMLMLRLLSGRLWEGWNLLKNGYEPIEPHYETDLSPDARAALGELRIYFAKRGNLIATVRDKIGFHADSGIVKRAFERMADDTDLGAYLCRTIGNTLYYSAELIHYEAINGLSAGMTNQGRCASSLETSSDLSATSIPSSSASLGCSWSATSGASLMICGTANHSWTASRISTT